jgi:hypothetical protein
VSKKFWEWPTNSFRRLWAKGVKFSAVTVDKRLLTKLLLKCMRWKSNFSYHVLFQNHGKVIIVYWREREAMRPFVQTPIRDSIYWLKCWSAYKWRLCIIKPAGAALYLLQDKGTHPQNAKVILLYPHFKLSKKADSMISLQGLKFWNALECTDFNDGHFVVLQVSVRRMNEKLELENAPKAF